MAVLPKKHIVNFTHSNAAHGQDYVIVFVRCVLCKEHHEIRLASELWERWIASQKHPSNPLVPLADYIGVDNAELLITGMCPKCWLEIGGH